MLLWGKEKDHVHGAGKEQELELDCEKQARKASDAYAVQPKTVK
jgi:hypothetical protein